MFAGLSRPVGTGGTNSDEDVFGAKGGLRATGDWNPIWDTFTHPTSEPEETFETAVTGFQDRFGLKSDGIIKPGGPTETTLRAESARRDLADRDVPEPPAALRLKRGVGANQPNRPDDVAPVQFALQALARPDLGLGPLMGTPPKLDVFQSKFGLKPDGIMLPGGPTEQTLNRLVGPLLVSQRLNPSPQSARKEAVPSPAPKPDPPPEPAFDPRDIISKDPNDIRNENPGRLCGGYKIAVQNQERKLAELQAEYDKEWEVYEEHKAETARLDAVAKQAARDSMPGAVSRACEEWKPRTFVGHVVQFICEHGGDIVSVIVPQKAYYEYKTQAEKEVEQHNIVKAASDKIKKETKELGRLNRLLRECLADQSP